MTLCHHLTMQSANLGMPMVSEGVNPDEWRNVRGVRRTLGLGLLVLRELLTGQQSGVVASLTNFCAGFLRC